MSESKEVPNEPESPRGKRAFRVVLTGGPCAGKTSSLSMISDHFRNLGWNVYSVPEAATLLVGGGVSWAQLNEDQGFHFQKNVIRTMMQIEDTYMEIASQSKDDRPSMILNDRGVMDCSAYVDSETFSRILAEIGIKSTFEVKEDRYDMVIHLFSAAIGAEAHYELANNSARTESADQARIVDKNILKAWTGHPSIVCIDNRTIFKEKVLRSVQAICKKLGVPNIGDSTIKRKLKISAINPVPEHENIHYCESECEYTYLMDGETMQQRLRKRGNNGSFIYTHIIRVKLENGKYSESSRNITKREYDSFLLMALPTNHRVLTLKRSFVFQNQYFNLLIYKSVCPGLMLLEIYEDPDVELKLPTDLFTIEKEVTNDSEYSMFNLSKK